MAIKHLDAEEVEERRRLGLVRLSGAGDQDYLRLKKESDQELLEKKNRIAKINDVTTGAKSASINDENVVNFENASRYH